ncbi:MAG: hypothetical protein ACK4IK_11605 [Bacteroidia bacterium]
MSEILLPLIYLILFNWLIVKFKVFHLPELGLKASLFAFNLKIIFGFIIWYIYTFYYSDRGTGDQYRYFDDAAIMFEAFLQKPIYFIELFFDKGRENEELKPFYERLMNWDKEYNYAWIIDNRTIIRFNALVHFFSWGNFHVHTIFMNFLSFSGLFLLYKSLIRFFVTKPKLLFIAVFLMPTVLFWGSGVLKEGIVIFGLGLFCYGFFNSFNEQYFNIKTFLFFIMGILVLASIKVYVLLCLIPAALTYFIIKKLPVKHTWLFFFCIQVAFVLLIFNLKWIHPELDIVNKLWFKRNDFINVANEWGAKSTIAPIPFEKSAMSIMLHSPQAIINSLFRPHILELKSMMYLMPFFENLLLLLLVILVILNFKKPDKQVQYFSMFALVFIVYLATMIGLTTPILGAIVRYKLPLMPFLLLILFQCLNIEKIIQKYPIINKLI